MNIRRGTYSRIHSIAHSLIILFGLTSCIDTIQLDLKDVGDQIVIEGKLTDDSTGNEILVTKAVDFQLKNDFPPVTDATVTVRDETTNQTEVLTQTYPGVYSIQQLKGISEHQYTLTVQADGNTYTATSTMPARVNFDQLTYESVKRLKTVTQMVAVYQDPASVDNYYRWVLVANRLQSNNVFVRSDVATNGNLVRQTIVDDVEINPGDTITVDMQCLSKTSYDYFNGLMKLQGNNINQGASPTNPQTNLSGGALGHFSAYTSQKRTVVVQ
ncbi:DUF4249 domain-containing protein [Spirosoma sp. SC4-14]|uniref:DUF4249 domain-containing protein n=1 Tax=Spirosoma sp. SC4-14 TaxID=3128900 RepID=UPI0030CC0F0C